MSMMVAVVATGPGISVGYRISGRSMGLGWSESKAYDDGKQRGGDYQSEELFHVGDFFCF